MAPRFFSTKDKVNEDQIKSMSGHGFHAILVLPIPFEESNRLNAT